MEFSVKSSLMIEPDGVYMLEGARVPMRLVEAVKTKDGTVTKGITSSLFLLHTIKASLKMTSRS